MASKRKASSSSSSKAASASSKKSKRTLPNQNGDVPSEEIQVALPVESCDGSSKSPPSRKKTQKQVAQEGGDDCRFLGEPVPDDEAFRCWPHRYQGKSKRKAVGGSKSTKANDDSEEIIQARRHYTKAQVDGLIFNIGDDAHVKAEEESEDYICRIVEMFEAIDGSPYFMAQWYYRAKDTVIKSSSSLVENKRVFFSEMKDDNPLNCLVEKLRIVRLPLNVNSSKKEEAKSNCDYFCDMVYLLPYSSFTNLPPENIGAGSESDSTISCEEEEMGTVSGVKFDNEVSQGKHTNSEMTLLDLYSGCGAMSTGLCLGANSCGVNLVTRWAVDINQYACESLKHNHPETEVRNESAEDFLSLLIEWKKLCASFSLIGGNDARDIDPSSVDDESEDDACDGDSGDDDDGEVFEVAQILAICYGDPKETGKRGLHLKIRWKGYGPEEDTWEPMDGLGDCQERLKEFVIHGYNSKILPLPGDVDVICGGPPCQGISGFNRFRNKENPLEDPKNKQLAVFMDIVDYLKPKFVLMENVVDLVRFASGFLGRYALARLIGMNYQARLGLMAAGAYGLPQFRMRVFLWGARPTEKLPQYPLPTHNLVVRGVIPTEFESHTVAFEEGHEVELEKELFLEDAISDLPPVENNERRDEMPYGGEPKTDFQKFIRLRKEELLSGPSLGSTAPDHVLFDHRPLELNDDDYQRVCQIPKRKGACFRDLRGVRVRDDNRVEWDPDVERVYLASGKPLVPDYAMTFIGGSSSKPFSRLWWDVTVPTVVTRAEPHNQTIMHPVQDRVLTIRENARLQGFPDYYKLFGPIKERYIQVGNAVAVPVARALGYALGLAFHGSCTEEALITLPKKFPSIVEPNSPAVEDHA
ncbi:DNA (cytosine-5)-methyltransferase CMT3 isoform X2 [Diospyros lotus]|uniref:DNA (cytosine-5)-methyltransferase CMT3 isoform X2 n=1 Tax=Diospyros lotus TaxID=55363 RepID=UPI0022513957|nr:DNA (cytosine-5)-methyltransferase CMT3 isoform X2 [Diospyros lotus]